MEESKYKEIIDEFLLKKISVDKFIDTFMSEWRKDRDKEIKYDDKFQKIIDRIFTSSDCYSENPESLFEISEAQLREEISFLYKNWYS